MNNNNNITETTEVTKPSSEHLAMEILKQQSDKSRAEIRGRNAGIIGLTVAVIVISVGMAVINYKNDCDWRELFGSYDFVTQDGGGQNNINTGTQGDVTNNESESDAETE